MQPFGGWIGLAGMRYRASYGGQFVNLFLQQPFSALMIPPGWPHNLQNGIFP